jgi:N-acetylmuramoyl-L-alanine amidase
MRYGRLYVPRGLARDVERYLQGGREPERPIEHVEPVRPPKETVRPTPRTVGRVCIDPGHGGKDPGTHSRSLLEKDLVLASAQLLAAELRTRGFEVAMTREGDFFVELEERPAVASRRGADLFVAIHANWIRDPSFHGIEIFYCNSPRAAASASVRRESLELVDALRDSFRRAGLTVRKVQDRDLRVLFHARVPAALVEIGYVSNRAEEQALRTTAYRQRVARAIADGIAAYRGGSK